MADGAAESAAAVGVEKRADVAGEEGVVSGGMVGCHLFLFVFASQGWCAGVRVDEMRLGVMCDETTFWRTSMRWSCLTKSRNMDVGKNNNILEAGA